MQVCLKSIMWYIEMHHARTFFLYIVMTFCFSDVHSQHVYLQVQSLFILRFLSAIVRMTAVYQLKIKNDHDKWGAIFLVSFVTEKY